MIAVVIPHQVMSRAAVIVLECLHRSTTFSMLSMLGRMYAMLSVLRLDQSYFFNSFVTFCHIFVNSCMASCFAFIVELFLFLFRNAAVVIVAGFFLDKLGNKCWYFIFILISERIFYCVL